jgi:transcription antitermination factor NusG
MAAFSVAPVAGCASGASSLSKAGVSWYAVRCRVNHERVIQAGLGAYGVECFLPLLAERVQWSDRTHLNLRALFAGYLFVQLEANGGGVPNVSGLLHLLPNNLEPIPVSEAEIHSIRLICASGLPVLPVARAVGEAVTIQRGVLAGASGVVVRVKNSLRLVVTLELLGRSVAVEIDAQSLKN